MPRDLTDLMERATSAAPPEPHAAADITRLAARRQRRRTTGLAAAAAVTVVAATGLGYGVTRGHDSNPQPAGQFKRDQTVDVSSAVPASSLPGYHLEPWTVPSVQHLGSGYSPQPTYRQLDAAGRLIVEDAPGGDPLGPIRSRVYDGPGLAPRPLQQPPSPGRNGGSQISWVPSFLGDGRLLWAPTSNVLPQAHQGFYLSDLDGGHRVFVNAGFHDGNYYFNGIPTLDSAHAEVGGGRMWFLVYSKADPKTAATTWTLYSATFGGALTKVAENVAVLAVNDGVAGWVTTDGTVVTESASGGPQHVMHVPLSPGCRVSATQWLQQAQTFAVSRSVIAVTERCGTGRNALDQVLAFDPSGRQLVHVTGAATFSISLGGDALLFEAALGDRAVEVLRYDLVTGRLARLAPGSSKGPMQSPRGAGDYVLWYDATGGHIARIPG